MILNNVVIDDVLDSRSVSTICSHIDQSTKDSIFYRKNDNHLHDNFCLTMIDIASQFYDLSSFVGYEFWTRLNSCVGGWHQDKDEKIYEQKGIESYPLCSIIYYVHVKNMTGGELLLDTDTILPKSNRMVIFAPGISHNVNEFTGDRICLLVNPWDKIVTI